MPVFKGLFLYNLCDMSDLDKTFKQPDFRQESPKNLESPQKLQCQVDKVDEWANAKVSANGSRSRRARLEIRKAMEGDVWQLCPNPKRPGKFKVKELLAGSKERIEPKCQHFYECGGCQWQHEEPTKLLQRKERFVLEHLAGILEEDTVVLPPQMADVWRYRNKMEYSFGSTQEASKSLGLHYGKSRVIDIQECPIAPEWFEKALAKVRQWWHASSLTAFNFKTGEGNLRQLSLREGFNSRMATLTVSGDAQFALSREEIKGYKEAILEAASEEGVAVSVFLTLQQAIEGKKTQFFEMHLHGSDTIKERLEVELAGQRKTFEFTLSPTTFFQPSRKGAQLVIQTAMQFVKESKAKVVWDLFCGSGTLGIVASHLVEKVYGLELNPMAVLDAQENAKLNERKNIEFKIADLHTKSKEALDLLLGEGKPDLVIVDPPRSGLLAQTVETFSKVAPAFIVYVSCNPLSLARDLIELKKSGYRLLKIAVIDQFPQTGHVETIGYLAHENSI